MKNAIRIFVLSAYFTFFSAVTFAQTNCADAIFEANKMYESGNFSNCISILENCTGNSGDKTAQLQKYRLIALCFFNLNNIEKTDYYIHKMLKSNPEYQKYPELDPIDFKRKLADFYVRPQLEMGLQFGFNINSVKLVQSYSVYNSPQRYLPYTGYQLGAHSKFNITENIHLNASLQLMQIGIRHEIDTAGTWGQFYEEEHNYTGLNLSLSKSIKLGKKADFEVGIGIATGYLLLANVYMKMTQLENDYLMQSTQNPLKMRNRFQYGALGMAGINYELSKGTISFTAGIQNFARNTVAEGKRMQDVNFNLNTHYVNDDIRPYTFMFNMQYSIPLTWSVQKLLK